MTRLQEIKNSSQAAIKSGHVFMKVEDRDWLIKQAELAEQYQSEQEYLFHKANTELFDKHFKGWRES